MLVSLCWLTKDASTLLHFFTAWKMSPAEMNRNFRVRGQVWGKGQKNAKDPGPVHARKYSKKLPTDEKIKFDLRPPHLRCTTDEEKNNFVSTMQKLEVSQGRENMFTCIFMFQYKDYSLSGEQKDKLKERVKTLEENLCDQAQSNLDTEKAFHIDDTIEQSNADSWRQNQFYRVTASIAKSFSSNPLKYVEDMWSSRDISKLEAVKLGREHEEDARKSYKDSTQKKVMKCGLFVSKENGCLGASPDGLIDKRRGLLETKCLFS